MFLPPVPFLQPFIRNLHKYNASELFNVQILKDALKARINGSIVIPPFQKVPVNKG